MPRYFIICKRQLLLFITFSATNDLLITSEYVKTTEMEVDDGLKWYRVGHNPIVVQLGKFIFKFAVDYAYKMRRPKMQFI